MSITRLILVRHGETEANKTFRYIGTRDDPLTELGESHAAQLAEALSMLPIAAVYCSPRQRAYQTALPIASRHGLPIQVIDELRECDFGIWEGLSRAEVMARSIQDAELLRHWEYDVTLAPPDGESLEMLYSRISVVIETLVETHPDQTVVLASHVGPIKAVLCTALGAPISSASRIFLDPATISVVDWRQTHPLVRLLNSHLHLGWQQARWMAEP